MPEIVATIDLYHQWLDAQKPSAGEIVDIEGQKRCHQVLGELEHVQVGVPIKRIALLDDVSHHSRFQALTDQMSDSEKETLRKVLQNIGAKGFTDLRLQKDIKRKNYAYVVA